MSITNNSNGRLCNQIIRNLALSLLARKYDLYVEYSNYEAINNILGIELHVGNKKHDKTTKIDDDKFLTYYNNDVDNDANFDVMASYFQGRDITDILFRHLRDNSNTIIERNPFKQRYNNNNDLFIHIRLTDAARFNVGIDYYLKCIEALGFDNLYIASDDFRHETIQQINYKYPNAIFVNADPVRTIQFGSTCRHIVLSHGSFSAIIGYLAFFSQVYYPNVEPGWCPLDMFINKGFRPIDRK